MKVGAALDELYRDYYRGDVAVKRSVAARQTVSHMLEMLPGRPYQRLLDVGAGDGSVLAELEANGLARELAALEISTSGLAAIRARRLKTLCRVEAFDGYRIDLPAGERYSVAIAAHVLEHVEHERSFIAALLEAADLVYIEVPLELTASIDASIRISGPYGHINYYTVETFRNLLVTSGAEVLALKVFANSIEYEQFLAGRLKGAAKFLIRNALLRWWPRMAQRRLTYLAGAVCRKPLHRAPPR